MPLNASAYYFAHVFPTALASITDDDPLMSNNGKLNNKNEKRARSQGRSVFCNRSRAVRDRSAPKQFQTTRIINPDDAIISNGLIVKNCIGNNKKQFPWIPFIVDNKAWSLIPAGAKIVLINKGGRFQCAKDGV